MQNTQKLFKLIVRFFFKIKKILKGLFKIFFNVLNYKEKKY